MMKQIEELIDSKYRLKSAIEGKGVLVDVGLRSYDEKIRMIDPNSPILGIPEGTRFELSKFESIPPIDISNMTSLYGLFGNCWNLRTIPYLNTSRITDMCAMFMECESLESIPQLNTSNVRDMSNMFYGCKKLTTIPQLDTHNVTDISEMFFACASLESVPRLDASNVRSTYMMFRYAPNLINIGGLVNLKKSIDFFDNPLLSTESKINIINDLYDWVENPEGLSENDLNGVYGATLRFYNISDLTDDDMIIATDKGWTIQSYI